MTFMRSLFTALAALVAFASMGISSRNAAASDPAPSPVTMDAAKVAELCGKLAARKPVEESLPGKCVPEKFENLGGLFVHVGSDDIAQTASMVKSGNFLIHCLYTKQAAFDAAQAQIASAGLGGKVSASMFDGAMLPFIDNAVNMLVIEDGFAVPTADMKRVLTPRGTARYYEAGERRELVKEVRDTIDEFTHNLYDGTNTGVSKDMEVGPPAHLQWTGKPDWMRSHDISASMQGMVTAGGRLFYVHDEATRSFISFAPDWQLVCRDAFNGKILWKRPLDQGVAPYLRGGKITTASLPHRIVAHADAVYVTLGMHQPIKAIDARTGKDLWTAPQTENTAEMILHNGVLYCAVDVAPKRKLKHLQDLMARPFYMTSSAVADSRKVMALDARNGATIWEKVPDSGKVLHLSLAVSEKGVFYHDAKESLVCLSNDDGYTKWRTKGVPYYKDLRRYSGANMVLYRDVVLYACASASADRQIRATTKNMIRAFDVDTGEFLWTAEQPQQGLFTTPDLLVAEVSCGLRASTREAMTASTGGYIPEPGRSYAISQKTLILMASRIIAAIETGERTTISSWVGPG